MTELNTLQMYSTTADRKKNEIRVWCLDKNSDKHLIRVKDFILSVEVYPRNTKTDEELIFLGSSILSLITNTEFSVEVRTRLTDNTKSNILCFKTTSLDSLLTIESIIKTKDDYKNSEIDISNQLFDPRGIKLHQWFTIQTSPVDEKISSFLNEFFGNFDTVDGIDLNETLEWRVNPSILTFNIENETQVISAVFTASNGDVEVLENERSFKKFGGFISRTNPVIIAGFGIKDNDLHSIYQNFVTAGFLTPIKNDKIYQKHCDYVDLQIPGRLVFDIQKLMQDRYYKTFSLDEACSKFIPATPTNSLSKCFLLSKLFKDLDFYDVLIQKVAVLNRSISFGILETNLKVQQAILEPLAVSLGYIPKLRNLDTKLFLFSNRRDHTKGIHRGVARYDIANFFPSLIELYNICPTTIATDSDIEENCTSIRIKSKTYRFVKPYIRVGLLPLLVRDLTSKRKSLLVQMRDSENSEHLNKILDMRQHQIKTLRNRVFGMLSDKLKTCVSFLADKTMEIIKSFFIEKYNAVIIRNDVDSLMVKIDDFENNRVQINNELANLLSPTIQVEFDGVIDIIIYDSVRFQAITDDNKFFSRFMVRANNCEFNKKLYTKIVEKILRCDHYTQSQMFEDILSAFRELKNGAVTKSDLYQSSTFGSYSSSSFYLNLFVNETANLGVNYKVGDKVSYYMVKTEKNDPKFKGMRSSLINYTTEEIDISYYFRSMSIIDKLFKMFSGREDEYFEGHGAGKIILNLTTPCLTLSKLVYTSIDLETDIATMVNAYNA